MNQSIFITDITILQAAGTVVGGEEDEEEQAAVTTTESGTVQGEDPEDEVEITV